MADFRNIPGAQFSKGLRNNNPLNINAAGWKGETGVDGSEAIFTNTIFGFRAAAIELLRYQNTYGLNTINDIVARWAPVADGNDPVTYAASVATAMGVDPGDQITLDAQTLNNLMVAMLPQEIGQQATAMIDLNDIPAAIAMINLPVLSVVQGANGYGGILLLSGIFLVLFALSEKK